MLIIACIGEALRPVGGNLCEIESCDWIKPRVDYPMGVIKVSNYLCRLWSLQIRGVWLFSLLISYIAFSYSSFAGYILVEKVISSLILWQLSMRPILFPVGAKMRMEDITKLRLNQNILMPVPSKRRHYNKNEICRYY